VSDHGDAVVPGTVLDFTDTTATWLVPPTAFYGHGQLFVSVSGVVGKGAPVEIASTPQAVGCVDDAQCGSGFCVDGVCCDRRCDGVCEACSAAKKQSGVDGVCGPIPPGTGACVLSLGTACSDGKECVTGFCSQGVCCDSTCTGTCQACNQQAHLGICSPISEGACGAACDGAHTVKKVGTPDVDCTPYTCEAQSCKTACASVKDCVPPFVCSLDGQCIAPPAAAAFDDSACGCRAAGGTRGVAGALAAALAFVAAGLRRRRRQ
jgi:MYXO-CTERM domain-containing protein